MNGINQNIYTKSLSGLSDIYADDIVTTNITATNIYTSTGTNILSTANDLQNQIDDIVSYDTTNTTTTNSLQSQINSILAYDMSNVTTINNLQNQVNGITSTSTTGGGYFNVVCERVGYGTVNSPFGFGAGIYNTAEIVLPTCILTMSRITASAPMTSGTSYFQFYKNGVGTGISTILTVSTSSGQYNHNISFTSGDTFKILALNSGSFGTNNATVQIRINCIFQCTGIKGADGISPTITLGSVSTLPSGSNASITNSGTSTNQIYNFNLPSGTNGINGTSPIISIGAVNTLNVSSLATVDISGTPTNPIFNFGIPVSTISIGSVSTLNPYSAVSITNSGTTTHPILNFGIPRGADGSNATQKGDKGDKGDPGKDLTVQVDINTAGLLTLGGIVAGIGANVLSNNAQLLVIDGTLLTIAGEITTIDATLLDYSGRITTLEYNVDETILPKVSNIDKSTDATQIHGKVQMTDTIPHYDIINDPLLKTKLYNNLAEFDSYSNTITLGKTTSSVDIEGVLVNVAQHSGSTVNIGTLDTNVNIEGQYINLGAHTNNVGLLNTINLEASIINVGVAGLNTTVNIGNDLATVTIRAIKDTTIEVSNFMSQF